MLRYDVVDVFTDRPFTGNPLAVVRGSEGLATEQLQAIASEFNLSETAFPVAPTPEEATAGADYRLRIFTPAAEIPFAGHPSIGTAWVLGRDGDVPVGRVGQACGAGVVRLHLPPGDGPVELSVTPQGVSPPSSPAAALAALGLAEGDAVSGLRVGGCGLDFGYVQVRRDALAPAIPSPAAMAAVTPRPGGDPLGGLSVYSVADGSEPQRIDGCSARTSGFPRTQRPGRRRSASGWFSPLMACCPPTGRGRTRFTRASRWDDLRCSTAG